MKYEPRPIMLPREFLRQLSRELVQVEGGRLDRRGDDRRQPVDADADLPPPFAAQRVCGRREIRGPADSALGRRRAGQCGHDALRRVIAVNLNYTVSSDMLNYCIEQCGIRHVLDQPKVHGAVRLQARRRAGLISKTCASRSQLADKLVAAARRLPRAAVACSSAGWACTRFSPTICSRSSTPRARPGEPKGVMLTYSNVGTNVAAIEDMLQPRRARLAVRHPAACFTRWASPSGCGRCWALPVKRHLSLQPAGRQDHRQALPRLRHHDHGLDAHLSAVVPAALRARGLRHDGAGRHRRRKTARDVLAAFEEKFGVRPDGRLRHDRAVADRVGQHSGQSHGRRRRHAASASAPSAGRFPASAPR